MKVPPGWEMPREIRARLGDRFGRQREIEADGHLFLVLRKVPAKGTNQREGVFFWRSPGGEWRSTDRGQPRSALQQRVDSYESAVNQLSEKHESSSTAAERFAVLEQIGPLNRALRNLADTLQRARDAVNDIEAKRDVQLLQTMPVMSRGPANCFRPMHVTRSIATSLGRVKFRPFILLKQNERDIA